MALRGRRDSSIIWPGFVDAVTTLLMVLMFVLTIFTVMQSVLRDTITTQDNELSDLTGQLAQLAQALGLEQVRADQLEAEVGSLRTSLTAAEADAEARAAEIVGLTGALAAREGALTDAQERIASFEAQVATLLAERDAARGEVGTLTASVADLEAAQQRLVSEQEALQIAIAQARAEIDADAEAARLAAARREALEALIADLRSRNAETAAELTASGAALTATQTELTTTQTELTATQTELTATLSGLAATQTELTAAEAARLADQAALAALQERLKGSDTELTAMTLALEEERKRAEETLTLLAAAQTEAAQTATAGERQASLLATAQAALLAEQDEALAAQRNVALLNEQIAVLRSQLGELQSLLDASAARDAAANVQLETLGSELNAALAQVAAEQKRRADLEQAERERLEAETLDLARYRSEFFGQLSTLLAGREGVRVVGDRFVFSSEVLFTAGSAELAPEGRAQIAGVAAILNEVATQIPPEIDWIIRVDGHTDNVPLSGEGAFADNWELSQARALSVVRFMQDELGFPPERMAATGFGEWRPAAVGDSAQARATNRRIELKLTER